MKKLAGALVAFSVLVVSMSVGFGQWAGGNGGYVSAPLVSAGTVVAGGTINLGNVGVPTSTISGAGGIHAVPPYPIWSASQGSLNPPTPTIPAGNWVKEGVEAYIFPMLAPNAPCSYQKWGVNALTALQVEAGIVSEMQTPTDIAPVTILKWYDTAYTGALPFFRNMQTTIFDGCVQSGTRIAGGLVVRAGTNQTSLMSLEGGLFTSEAIPVLRLANGKWAGSQFGNYGIRANSSVFGVNYGLDGFQGTDDDVGYFNGEYGTSPVNEIYYTGITWYKPLYPTYTGLRNYQNYFVNRNLVLTIWYRGWSLKGSKLFELRTDIPIDWVPEYRFTITPGAPGTLIITIFGWKNAVYRIERTAAVNPNDPNAYWELVGVGGSGIHVIEATQVARFYRVRP